MVGEGSLVKIDRRNKQIIGISNVIGFGISDYNFSKPQKTIPGISLACNLRTFLTAPRNLGIIWPGGGGTVTPSLTVTPTRISLVSTRCTKWTDCTYW